MTKAIAYRRWAGLALGLALGATAVVACKGRSGKTGSHAQQGIPWICAERGGRPSPQDAACPDGQRFVKGACDLPRCDVGELGPSNCCPGTFCSPGGICEVRRTGIIPCSRDSDCTAGKRCLDRPQVNAETPTCGFPPVDPTGGCAEGLRPFNGRCIDDSPCGGGCPAATVCNIDTDQCEPVPSLRGSSHGCDQSCGPGQLLVYSDPDSMLFDRCCQVVCACETLPELPPGRWGRYSDIAVADGGLVISAYDTTHGDLVAAWHGFGSESATGLEYVDGTPPAAGEIVANPDGLRGGVRAPGEDVGLYTALALHDGEPRIAYYDAEARRLKYAARDGTSGTWSISVIDERQRGDVGRYTSLVIDQAGRPHVSYLAHGILVEGRVVTTPMYARAATASPRAPTDWERMAVEPVDSCALPCGTDAACVSVDGQAACQPLAATCGDPCPCGQACVGGDAEGTCLQRLAEALEHPCGGDCPERQVCAIVHRAGQPAGAECLPARTDCDSPCDEGLVCVEQGAQPACQAVAPTSSSSIGGLPNAVGLFTSLVLHGGTPTLVYYDRVHRHLRGAVASFSWDGSATGSTGFSTAAVACTPEEDVGQHPSLAVNPVSGDLAVAFQGRGGGDLWYFEGPSLFTGELSRLDDGIRGGNQHLVGANPSLAFGPTGTPYVAYADQTDNDLLLTYRRNDRWEEPIILLNEGAYGSFARLVINGGYAHVSNYLRARDSRGRDAGRLVVLQVDLGQLP